MVRVSEQEQFATTLSLAKLIRFGWLHDAEATLGVGKIFNPLTQEGLDEFNVGYCLPYGYYTWPIRLVVKIDLLEKKVKYVVRTMSKWGQLHYQELPADRFDRVLQEALSGHMGKLKAVGFNKHGMMRERKTWVLEKPFYDPKWYEEIYQVSVLKVCKEWSQKGFKPLHVGDHLMMIKRAAQGTHETYNEYWWISEDVADALMKIDSGVLAAQVMLELEKNYSLDLTAADVKRIKKEVSKQVRKQ